MKKLAAVCSLVTVAIILFFPGRAPAATWYVPDDFATIQAAVDGAASGDTITVRDGIHSGVGNRDITIANKSLVVQSENGMGSCSIDCQNSGRGFSISEGSFEVTIDGFQIGNGNRSGYGSWPENSGGGIYISSGSPTIKNCIFVGNYAESYGGAIMNHGADSLITNCVIGNNTSGGSGGGIRSIYSDPTITNCVVTGNNAVSNGGGISIGVQVAGPAGGPHITNCLVADNTALNAAGLQFQGVQSGPLLAVMTNCTVADNTATTNAGGLMVSGGASLTATDCIFWGNESSETSEIVVYAGLNPAWLTIGYSDVAGGQAAVDVDPSCTLTWNAGNINSNPLFTPVDDYYLSQIAAGQGSDSPCVDAGSTTAAAAGLDEAWTRFDFVADSGTVDMGFHYGATATPPPVTAFYVPDDYATIQAALDGVSAGETIIVRDGTYTGAANRYLDFGGKDITLQSENGPATCIIDCQGAGAGFLIWQAETSAAIIDGFTVTNGNAPYGGGIYCVNASPTIQNCVVDSCSSEYGSGITLWNSLTSLTNCTIVGNTSTIGAGGVFLYASDSEITHCTIADNVATAGGGIFCYDSLPTITNSIVTGNSATYGPQLLLAVTSSVDITYSNVESGANAAYVEPGCTLNLGAGSIDRVPRFVGAGDYHLLAVSPCVDTGTDAAVNSDIDGDARAYGSGFDMGSDECAALPGALTQINLEAPADLATLSSAPALKWMPDGGTDGAFVVDVAIPGLAPLTTGPVTSDTSWALPPGIWSSIPSGSQVYWRVRGADLDQTPLSPVISVEVWSFTKQ